MLYDIPGKQELSCREETARTRDRVLLYAAGLDLDPVLGVELALASMRKTGLDCGVPDGRAESPGLPEVMAEFRRLLDGHERSLCVADALGAPLVSMPPLNRRPMLPEEMDRSPVRRALKKMGALLGPAPAKLS